jgi:hypothetical protein
MEIAPETAIPHILTPETAPPKPEILNLARHVTVKSRPLLNPRKMENAPPSGTTYAHSTPVK